MDDQKQMTTDLVSLAHDTGMHIHLVAHCRKPQGGDESKPPGKHDLRGSAAITDQCDNVLTVWANKAKEEAIRENPEFCGMDEQPDAAITICKQRNSDFEGRLKLWFDRPSMRFIDERNTEISPW